MRIGRLNEIANIDEFLSCDLMADTRADTIFSGIITHSGVLLEHVLHVSQGLNLLSEATKPRHSGGVQQMVLKDCVL